MHVITTAFLIWTRSLVVGAIWLTAFALSIIFPGFLLATVTSLFASESGIVVAAWVFGCISGVAGFMIMLTNYDDPLFDASKSFIRYGISRG